MCKTLRKIKPKGIAQGELPTTCTSTENVLCNTTEPMSWIIYYCNTL